MLIEAHYMTGESPGGVLPIAELYSCETVGEVDVITTAVRAILKYADRNEQDRLRLGDGFSLIHYQDLDDVRGISQVADFQKLRLDVESPLANRPLTFGFDRRLVLQAILEWATRLESIAPESAQIAGWPVADWLVPRSGAVLSAMKAVTQLAYSSGQQLQWAIDGNRTEAFFQETLPEPGVKIRAVTQWDNHIGRSAVIVASSELLSATTPDSP